MHVCVTLNRYKQNLRPSAIIANRKKMYGYEIRRDFSKYYKVGETGELINEPSV